MPGPSARALIAAAGRTAWSARGQSITGCGARALPGLFIVSMMTGCRAGCRRPGGGLPNTLHDAPATRPATSADAARGAASQMMRLPVPVGTLNGYERCPAALVA